MFLTMLKCFDVVELELTSIPAYFKSQKVSLVTDLFPPNGAYIMKPTGNYSIQFNHGRVH